MDIQAIRRDFPALEQYTWFQNGGVSITPVPVAAEYMRWTEEMVRRGPLHIVYPEEEYPRRKAAMERLARALNGPDPRFRFHVHVDAIM